MTIMDLDERAREALAAAWASRRSGRARQVLLLARAGEAIAADVLRLPGARADGDVVFAVVSAPFAAQLLDVMYGFRGDEVREADPERALVVLVADEEAVVMYLDLHAEVLELFEEAQGHAHEEALERWGAGRRARGGKPLRQGDERGTSMKKKTLSTVAAPSASQIQAAPAPEKPVKKAKKRVNRKKFGQGQYGTGTKRTVAETREQIEALLARYGCSRFGFVNDAATNKSTVQFRCRSRTIRFVLELPEVDQLAEMPERTGKPSAELLKKRHDKALRGRWRALYAAIKAKLVLVDYRIETFEEAFVGESVDESSGLTVNELIRQRRVLPELSSGHEVAAELLPPARRRGIVEARAQ
ncbi:hypothetical protein WMF30_40305 [Sorangium sp. So ce134]